MSRADVVIGPWMDHAMDNIVFLPAGTAVLEVVPPDLFEEERNSAKKEALCLGLDYDQVEIPFSNSTNFSYLSR